MKFTENTNSAYRHVILEELGKKEKDLTGKEVLDHLFGNYYNDYKRESRYTLRRYVDVETKTIHRINAMWIYPLWIVFVMPAKWLLTGTIGVKTESKVFRVLRYLLGNVK